MASFKIIGKPTKISKEELRAMLSAISIVLEFHNKTLYEDMGTIKVKLKPRTKFGTAEKSKKKSKAWGTAWWQRREIHLIEDANFDQMMTLAIHEVIHLYVRLDDSHIEKGTDILTNRLKPTVARIYEVLIDNVYQRAGYIAHLKISYFPEGHKDEYDKSSWEKVEVDTERGQQLRKKAGQIRYTDGDKRIALENRLIQIREEEEALA